MLNKKSIYFEFLKDMLDNDSEVVILTRSELAPTKRDRSFEDINVNDFIHTKWEECVKADYVLFLDGNWHKILKHRVQIY